MKKRMKKGQRNRLDGSTAEQLLQRVPDAAEGEEFGTLPALLRAAAAVPAVPDDPSPTGGEEAAVAAFRAASAGMPRQRRRWTPGLVKAGIGAVAAALTFGGMAVAVQTEAFHLPFPGGSKRGPGGAQVSASASARPSTTPAPGELPDGSGAGTASAGGRTGAPASGAADLPATDRSLRSLCTAYRAARRAHGDSHPPGGPRRLVQATGSEAAVADYCARLLASGGTRDTGHSGDSTPDSGAAGRTPAASSDKKAK
ncbi:hypothetical protein [Streptomyces hygroscopicus]|uniref:hypothetical protein n=1 Tax=Streptomyces hygroscopicus TaxID=1912 RepID=UPI002240AA9A|nr:hypothetical protein [Streptomyces hygroscopicus]